MLLCLGLREFCYFYSGKIRIKDFKYRLCRRKPRCHALGNEVLRGRKHLWQEEKATQQEMRGRFGEVWIVYMINNYERLRVKRLIYAHWSTHSSEVKRLQHSVPKGRMQDLEDLQRL